MPRSAFVLDLINDKPPLPPERYEAEMDAAIRYVVAMQEHAGLDVVTDGEWWRKSYIGVIAELAHGFELGHNPRMAGRGRSWWTSSRRSSPASSRARFPFSRRSRRGRSRPRCRPRRCSASACGMPEKSAKAYPKRDDFVRDCVPILQRELELIREAGADIIQIDDPHLCLFVDPNVRRQFPDPDAAADFAVDMVNAVVDGSRNVKLAVHLCRRAGARARGEAQFQGGYDPIIKSTQSAEGAPSHDGVHRARLRRHGRPSQAARGFRDRPGLRQRHARPDRFCGDDRGPGATGGQGSCPGADRPQPRLRICAGSGAVVGIDEAYRKLCNEVEAAQMLREEFACASKLRIRVLPGKPEAAAGGRPGIDQTASASCAK